MAEEVTIHERIEQSSPESKPYRATYVFYGNMLYSIHDASLSPKELAFYTSPEVNEAIVVHTWLNKDSKLERNMLPPEPTFDTHSADCGCGCTFEGYESEGG